MKKINIFTTFAAIVFSTTLLAQTNTSKELTLKESLTAGIKGNFDLLIVQQEQQISKQNATLGNAGFLPSLDLIVSAPGVNNTSTTYPKSGDAIDGDGSSQNLDGTVNLSWTIFDGFKAQATYDKLKELEKIGELNSRIAVENLAADIASTYYEIIRQQVTLQNLKSTLALSLERKYIVKIKSELGSASKLDYQQALVDYNEDTTRYVKQKEIVYRYKLLLNKLISNTDIEANTQIKDLTIAPLPLNTKDQIWAQVQQSNSYLLMSEHNKQLSEEDLKIVRSRNYPYVKANGDLNSGSTWYNGTQLNKQYRDNNINYGVTVGMNLFDGMNRRREQINAKSRIKIAELESKSLQQSLQADFANFWASYINNKSIIDMEIKNVSVAEEYLVISMERYKLEELSGLELREAQNSLLDAKERLIAAQYDTKMCEISLLLISGEILPTLLGE